MIIIPIGMPGSGKGTQAEFLSKKLNIPHISTGDLFRFHTKNETDLGLQVKKYMDEGGLVPDDITNKIVEERLTQEDCKKGFILDGYPRDINQIEELQKILDKIGQKITYVLYFHLDITIMLERLRGRWSCKKSDHIYHEKFSPPKIAGICDIDGSELYQRADQQDDAIQERIKKYARETGPVVEFYKNEPYFIEVDASKSIEEINQILDKLVSIF